MSPEKGIHTMKGRTYSTSEAAREIGLSLRQLNRWLRDDLVKPTVAVPIGAGRTLWRWTPADIRRAKRLVGTFRPGPKRGVQ